MVAAAFVMAGQEVSQATGSREPPRQPSDLRESLPPSIFDPYAAASLRQVDPYAGASLRQD